MFAIVDAALLTNKAEWSPSEILFNKQLLNRIYGILLVDTILNNVALVTALK
jgi:hypothetical protein